MAERLDKISFGSTIDLERIDSRLETQRSYIDAIEKSDTDQFVLQLPLPPEERRELRDELSACDHLASELRRIGDTEFSRRLNRLRVSARAEGSQAALAFLASVEALDRRLIAEVGRLDTPASSPYDDWLARRSLALAGELTERGAKFLKLPGEEARAYLNRMLEARNIASWESAQSAGSSPCSGLRRQWSS